MARLTRLRIILIAFLVVAWSHGGWMIGQDAELPSSDQKDKRLAVPSSAIVKETLELVRDIYKTKFQQSKTPAQKRALAKKLLSDGVDTEDDANGPYVLFQLARRLATESGDMETTLEAIDQIVPYRLDLQWLGDGNVGGK